MKPSDPGITWIDEKPLGLAERLYLPLLSKDLLPRVVILLARKTR